MAGNGDFIEVYEGVLDAQACRSLLRRFEASGHDRPGLVGGGYYPELKDSRDLCISGRAEWRDVEQLLNQAVFLRLLHYLRRYNHALIAPLMVQRNAGSGAFERLDQQHLAAMDDAELSRIAAGVFRPGRINLQHYRADQGGYPYWHCELYPREANAETLHRHLLWTLYLNDGFAAGETEFLHQDRLIKPRTGSLLIAPTAFTHTHRGNRPQGGDKFIATSWILFQPAERLYGEASTRRRLRRRPRTHWSLAEKNAPPAATADHARDHGLVVRPALCTPITARLERQAGSSSRFNDRSNGSTARSPSNR